METVFLLSLPRSGSTLLQRVLATHPEIATTSEPWILLPLVYAFRKKGIIAEYEHHNLAQAMVDFCTQLPNGKDDCFFEMKEMVTRLYEKLGGEAKYFLDKTPRYHLIIDELLQMYPNCKIILLWRNPLAIAASMMETWDKGKWNLYWFHVDLYKGLENLVNFYSENSKNVMAIKFEDFVSEPIVCSKMLFEYLGLSVSDKASSHFTEVNLSGRMGDSIGVKKYNYVSDESLNKWKSTLANPLRKIWACRYLNWIGDKRLSLMGYCKDELITELGEEPLSINRVFSDFIHIMYTPIFKYLNKRNL